MSKEKQRAELKKLLKKCPDVLTPMKAARWSPIGKNAIYAAIKSGEIEAYLYKNGYIFTKDSLIDYLVKLSDGKGRGYALRGDKGVK